MCQSIKTSWNQSLSGVNIGLIEDVVILSSDAQSRSGTRELDGFAKKQIEFACARCGLSDTAKNMGGVGADHQARSVACRRHVGIDVDIVRRGQGERGVG